MQDSHDINSLVKIIFNKINSNFDQNIKIKFENFSNKNNFVEIKENFKNINIKISKINLSNTKIDNNEIYFGLINIKYKNQYCLIEKEEEKYKITLNNEVIYFNFDQFNNLNFLKVWKCSKLKKNFNYNPKENLNFESEKNKYIVILFFLKIISFILLIVGNLYLKIIIQDIIPTGHMFNFIFLSLFFLLIFVINILIESFLKIYRYKKIKNISLFYFNNFLNTLLDDNLKNKEKFLLNIKSIFPIIEKRIFALPDFFSNIFISITISFILGSFSYFFIIIIFVIIFFNLLVFYFRKNIVDLIGNKKNEMEINIEKNIHEYIDSIQNEWNHKKFINKKNKIINMINDLQHFQKFNIYKMEKIEIFEKIGSKIIFIIFIIISVFLIANKFESNLTVGITLYLITLLNLLNEKSNLIFEFFSNLNIYKIHQNNIDNFLKPNKIDNGLLKFNKKIKKIEFINFNKNYKNKVVFNKFNKKFKNDTVIFGKNGIGKTTLLVSVFKENSNSIFIDGIKTTVYDKEEIKNKIIYLSSNNILYNFDFEKLIHYNPEKTKKIIDFLNENKIIEKFNKKEKSKGEEQILNLLNIIHEKNKILLLDEPMSNVDSDLKIKFIKLFKEDIIKNNFLIYISHDKKIKKFFKNKMVLKNV